VAKFREETPQMGHPSDNAALQQRQRGIGEIVKERFSFTDEWVLPGAVFDKCAGAKAFSQNLWRCIIFCKFGYGGAFLVAESAPYASQRLIQ